MKYQFDGYNYLVRMNKGEELVECLVSLAKENKIKGAWVSAIGGGQAAELGFYHLDRKEYSWHKVNELVEILSLSGTLAWDGDEPTLHAHAVLSNDQGQTYGGHVKELVVGGTCEVFVHVWNGDQLSRTYSEEIGLKLLNL